MTPTLNDLLYILDEAASRIRGEAAPSGARA